MQVCWTPRRLVTRAEVLARQADREEPVWGPSLKAAKDAAGKWTGAAQGFARKNGVAVDGSAGGRQGPGEARASATCSSSRRPRAAPRAKCCPAVIAATLRGPQLPEAHELGRLARRRQGGVPVRPAHPLAGRDARRHGVPFVIYELVGRGEGQGAGGERSGDAGPSLPAEGRGRRRPQIVRSLGELQRGACGAISCSSTRRSARRSIDARAARSSCGGATLARRSRPPRGVARPGGVPDGVGGRRSRRSSARCRARCSRPSSSITRSTSRSLNDDGNVARLRGA